MPSEQIWFKDPHTLFTKDNWTRFVPTPDMTTTEALNAVVRFSIYFTTLLFAVTHDGKYLILIPAVLSLSFVLFKLFPNGKKLEAYTEGSLTMPTPNNPFMNVLLTDIGDNPNRPDAAPVTNKEVRIKINKAFQHTNDIYMDTTDLFDQTQAMRTFHTLQSSKVPNDQDGFLAWLAKGYDEPNHSSAPAARGGKILSEGYVAARGSAIPLPSSSHPRAIPSTSSSSTK